MADWLIWLQGAIVLVAITALVSLAWWALFGDRARGRRRCPSCWYDLSHAPATTCAECGQTARSEAHLGLTRRRWGLATLAIIGCTGVGVYVLDAASSRGWATYVPTRVLVMVTPWIDGPATVNELTRRATRTPMTVGQVMGILEMTAAGDGQAAPPSAEWEQKYVQLMQIAHADLARRAVASDRLEVDGLDDRAAAALTERADDLLLSLPARVELLPPERWPAGAPITVEVRARDWWPPGTHARIVAQPKLPDAVTDAHVRLADPIQPRSYSLKLPALNTGEHEIAIDLTVDRRRGFEAPWTNVASMTQSIRLETTSEAMGTPVSSDELDEAVKAAFANGLVWWPSGSLPVRVFVNGQATAGEFPDIGFAIRVDVLRNGRLGRQLEVWWANGNTRSAWEVPMLDDSVLAPPPTEDDHWQIVARSAPELIPRLQGAKKYWDGEVRLDDVPVVMGRGGPQAEAPSRGWIPQSDPVVGQLSN